MNRPSSLLSLIAFAALVCLPSLTTAQEKPATPSAAYDEAMAQRVGADESGMRNYVLVVLKTGPTRVPDGPERDEMFRAHFANIQRLSKEGVLVHAGPLDGVDGWRGLFIFAVADIEEARKHVATDPVVVRGEMVAEYHKHYGSAALMLMRDAHDKLAKKSL